MNVYVRFHKSQSIAAGIRLVTDIIKHSIIKD